MVSIQERRATLKRGAKAEKIMEDEKTTSVLLASPEVNPVSPAAAAASPPPEPEPAETVATDNEQCYFCGTMMYAVERISAEGRFFHRSCFTCHSCSITLRLGGYVFDKNSVFVAHIFGDSRQTGRRGRRGGKTCGKGRRDRESNPRRPRRGLGPPNVLTPCATTARPYMRLNIKSSQYCQSLKFTYLSAMTVMCWTPIPQLLTVHAVSNEAKNPRAMPRGVLGAVHAGEVEHGHVTLTGRTQNKLQVRQLASSGEVCRIVSIKTQGHVLLARQHKTVTQDRTSAEFAIELFGAELSEVTDGEGPQVEDVVPGELLPLLQQHHLSSQQGQFDGRPQPTWSRAQHQTLRERTEKKNPFRNINVSKQESTMVCPLQVIPRLVLRLSGGEVILQEALQVLEGGPLLGLLPPAVQHQFMERSRTFRRTRHPVAALHLIQNLSVHHAWDDKPHLKSSSFCTENVLEPE
ncbi:hypothetical protein CCH79_00006383, partial [Gambusia affinis]